MTEENAELRTIDKLTGRMQWLNRCHLIEGLFGKEQIKITSLQQEWQTRTYKGNIWTGKEKLWWQDVPTVEDE